MSIFKFDVDADGIAVISWDVPGASMNVMSTRKKILQAVWT